MRGTAKERLLEYLKEKGIGRNKFETMAGISLGYITNLKNTPKEAQLVKILQAAPDLNRVWLLTGEGEMFTDKEGEKFVPSWIYKDLLEKYEKVVRENESLRIKLLNDGV